MAHKENLKAMEKNSLQVIKVKIYNNKQKPYHQEL